MYKNLGLSLNDSDEPLSMDKPALFASRKHIKKNSQQQVHVLASLKWKLMDKYHFFPIYLFLY